MGIARQAFFNSIKAFKLKKLFNEMGWDNANVKHPIKVDNRLYTLTSIAQKKDFMIFLCTSDDGGGIPDSAARKKIDKDVTKIYYEHLIIYVDGKQTRQHWELMIREQNKPVVCRPIDYYASQEPELLFQKLEGLFFTYEDEEKLSIVDVRSRVMANFEKNAEVVTKKFYERFQKEHRTFLGFIEGIQSQVDQEWYASLMLNRLMFIYFIQKKGFLDHNKDYLRSKLEAIQQKKGKNKFYSFYRDFLLILFHQGLGSPQHDSAFIEEFGRVPYLNGGLFDVHKIERENKAISIADEAFERIFDFFDEYNWHLDTRVTATGRDINPDVIGYIFEKYINDRAAMGAYYTKEDITEYISKNCIVPWLFDDVKRRYAKAFGKESEIWTMLQHSSDKYIYPAVKHGIPPNGDLFGDLPEEVQAGFSPDLEKKVVDENAPHLFEIRKCWNKPAPPEIALPTEIYRELITRRRRYAEVKGKIAAGEIIEINDFITYNLDIRQFAQDVLKETEDAELIKHFYQALRRITVLDPTCGSGAFLFAALNVLEPLYFECVKRMREFVEEHGKGRHKFFEEQLAVVDAPEHPSTEYFIYKTIILHNLYGVDIMKEAVEIAKLRLFLKLVATVDVDYAKPNLGLEPLPDIDFNIRSGNTLVGYATLADLDKAQQGELFGSEEKQAILEQADVVSRAYARFKDAQVRMYSDPRTYKEAKDDLNGRLKILNDKLNKYLAVTYLDPSYSRATYDKWLASHQPFHWLAEFYWIMQEGGFDVIIGNPPYVEYSKVKEDYTLQNYKTESCGNLYANVIERSFAIQSKNDRFGMIVQLPIVCTDRMIPLQKECIAHSAPLWFTNFDDRPGKLFDGLQHIRASILISRISTQINNSIFSTTYNRWYTEARSNLFELQSFQSVSEFIQPGAIPKIGNSTAKSIRKQLKEFFPLEKYLNNLSSHKVYFHNSPQYWIRLMTFIPYFWNERDGEQTSTQIKALDLSTGSDASVVASSLNSTLFYWWFISLSDCRHLNLREIINFPIGLDLILDSMKNNLVELSAALMFDLTKHKQRKETEYKTTGRVVYDEFYPKYSKPIIDEIDTVLARHYGFTEEELDFIINYDIKYRMGKELQGDE